MNTSRLWPFRLVLVSYLNKTRVSPVVGSECMTYSSAPLHSAPLEPLAPSDSSSPDPFSEYDNSVSGVVVVVPAFSVAVLSPAASAFRSSPAPDSSLCRSAPTIFGGPVSPPVVPSPHREPESAALQQIARPYSVSGGPMSSPSRSLRPLLPPPGGGTATSRPSLSVAVSPSAA